MAADTGFSPTDQAFHRWLAKNRSRVAARHDCTVIYSGMDDGGVPEWKKLADHERTLRTRLGLGSGWRWQSIEDVLTRLDCKLAPYANAAALPPGADRFDSMWAFACGAPGKKLVSRHEGQQIWFNPSAAYVKNASGAVYIFKGDVLKSYPDLLLAEIPTLAKNKNLSPDTLRDVIKLIPDSKKLWEKYRSDSADGRAAGR